MTFPAATPSSIRLTDVTARDGLQSLKRVYPVVDRLRLIELSRQAGIDDLEVGSFARPDVIPQLADTAAVLAALPDDPGCTYRVLVPNLRGAQLALDAGATHLVGVITASESYSLRNQRMTVDDALDQLAAIVQLADRAGAKVASGVGMAMFCPYQGSTPITTTLRIVGRMVEIGIDEVTLAASVGVETPGEVAGLCAAVRERWPELELGLHLHNLNGMALASAWAASRIGVSRFEGTLCGIGGGIVMPPGVEGYGNVALEDLAAMFIGDGHDVGTSLPGIVAAARAAAELLGLDRSAGHASGGWTRDEVLATSGARERTLAATGRS